MATQKRMTIKRAEHISPTIGESFNEFIETKEAKGCSESTIRNYKQSFKLFIRFNQLSLDTKVTDIVQPHFIKWINHLKTEGKSVATINHYLRDIDCYIQWLMDKKYVSKEKIEFNKVKGQEEMVKFYTEEELQRLLRRPRQDDSYYTWRMWTIVNWIMATGNRAGTIAELKISDIDLKAGFATLRAQKNKQVQNIPLSAEIVKVLKEWIREWRNRDYNENMPADPYLFPNGAEGPMNSDALAKAFRRYCNERQVKRASLHGLRHSYARLMVKNGSDSFKLQRMLNHSTLDMTRKYVKLFAEDIKEGYDAISPLDNMVKKTGKTIQRSK